MSIKKQLDELITFYERHRPEAGKEIPVCATANTVRKFCKKRDGVYHYRKRIIVPIRPVRTRDEILAEKIDSRR
jgi:hypothetical protein